MNVIVLAGLLVPTACDKGGDDGDDAGIMSAGTEDGGGMEEGSTSFDPMNTGGAEEDMPGAEESGGMASSGTGAGEETGGFISDPDGGGVSNECDIWAQDCPEDEKCMPWANDGSNSWNATRCSPVSPNPGQPGDSCTVEGSGVSGIDDCDVGSMCWDVDPETNEGTCVGFCEGSPESPTCPQGTGCSISNEGTLILCLPFCDPLLQDCPDGNACYPEASGFYCSPDASGADAGGFGDPCEFLNACDEGFWCATPASVPGCAAAGCCSSFCDVSETDVACEGQGQECTPFYEDEEGPPGYENVGVCMIPSS